MPAHALHDSFATPAPGKQQLHLLKRLCARDIALRYRGSRLGMVWAVLVPLSMLAVYTLVFGVVFQSRWSGQAPQATDTGFFALMLYSGLMVHQCIAEVFGRSAGLVVAHASYVKKVVFPLPLLSLMAVSTAAFNLMIQFLLLLIFCLFLGVHASWTWLSAPLLFVPLWLALMGLSWFVSALGVYVRDLEQVTGFITTLLLFLSPVFYPASAIPEGWRFLIELNPLTWFIEPLRAALFNHQWPSPAHLAALYVGSFSAAAMGLYWFRRTRHGFNDVL